MKPTWWKPLGVIGGLLLIAGILIFVLTKGSIADIVGGCVIVAGILGAMTVSSRIFFIQAVPAIIAAVLLIFGL